MFEPELINYWTVCFFLFGTLFGSFSNVVIYRLPLGKSVVSPRSACPQCKNPIFWYDNIPLLSWPLLRAKCRNCKGTISFRYFLVEIIMGFLFALSFWKFQWTWNLLEILILIFGLVTISFIDIDHFIIPDKLSLPGIVIGVLGALVNPDRSLVDAILGVLMGGGFLWAVAYVYYVLKKEEGLGGGDIKLLAWIGAVCSWKSIPFVILGSSILGSVVGLSLIAKNKGSMKSVIPFGPYIAFAAIVYIFFGEEITSWYISIFLPNL